MTDTSTTETVRWLSPTEQKAWSGFRRMRQLLDLQLARDLARDSGLSEPDYDVLSTLTEKDDARWRQGELATRLLWSTSRLAHHVDRMEMRGLVARESCDDDGRGAVLSLTKKGRKTLERAAPLHVASVREHFVDLLTKEEIDCLGVVSARVVDRLAPIVSPPAR